MVRTIQQNDRRVADLLRDLPTTDRFDQAMIRLSSLADHGALWAITGVALAVTGRRAAATRGIFSLAIASASANLIAKQLFGGTRPPLIHVPIRRQLRNQPTSATFPSGHSASAFAFAAGASISDRRLGILLFPLAAAVAYSRLHTGAHWFSDVIGGSILGVAAALLDAALHSRRQSGRPPVREGTAAS